MPRVASRRAQSPATSQMSSSAELAPFFDAGCRRGARRNAGACVRFGAGARACAAAEGATSTAGAGCEALDDGAGAAAAVGASDAESGSTTFACCWAIADSGAVTGMNHHTPSPRTTALRSANTSTSGMRRLIHRSRGRSMSVVMLSSRTSAGGSGGVEGGNSRRALPVLSMSRAMRSTDCRARLCANGIKSTASLPTFA